ncbi:MAG: tRNA lysidine(34) synthetase TilS [Beutenbergiaceae bacterium]
MRAAVRAQLAQQLDRGNLAAEDLVLVACSGGPDSVALASQVAFVAPRLGVRAGAAIIDHHMQPGSAEVAATAAELCRSLGLDPVLVRTPSQAAPAAAGPEGAARTLRYRELRAAAQATGARAVLLGHTLDDQAETVLLALARGSGTRSLAGMAALRGLFWRPLLDVDRRTTHAVCAALGLPVVTDPTNAADGPWRRADAGPLPRAAIRDLVLPTLAHALGADPAPALARTARLARADAEFLDELAQAAAQRCRHPDGGWDVAALAAEPAPLRARVLRRAAFEAGVPAGDLSSTHVDALEALITAWRGQGEVALPGRVTGWRNCGRLVLAGSRRH